MQALLRNPPPQEFHDQASSTKNKLIWFVDIKLNGQPEGISVGFAVQCTITQPPLKYTPISFCEMNFPPVCVVLVGSKTSCALIYNGNKWNHALSVLPLVYPGAAKQMLSLQPFHLEVGMMVGRSLC